MSIKKDGKPIINLEDWRVRAGPKSDSQWVEGRSAMETARAWLDAGSSLLPKEVESILTRSLYFDLPSKWEAEPEAKLRFDSFAGEPRNSDLLVTATDAHGDFVIAVEAKADETFGETVTKARANAAKRKAANPRSNGLIRIEQLVSALLGDEDAGSEFGVLRYQLLTATAGALAEAERRGVNRAVMLIQEFVTDKTDDNKHIANGRDLDRFIEKLSRGVQSSIQAGNLAGPFAVPGRPLFAPGTQLFIGKAVRQMRTRSKAGAAKQIEPTAGENQFGRLEVPDSALRPTDIPLADPFEWAPFSDFALSFDGYANAGDDCSEIAIKAEDEFRRSGTLPFTMVELRACVFFVQRQWKDDNPTAEIIEYIRALLGAIRAKVIEH